MREEGYTPQEIRRWRPYLTAQIGAESNFTQGVGSPAGARDIAQFMPTTAPGYGVRLGDNDIRDDIRGQVRYMKPLLRQHGVEGALRGYNAGPAAIERSKGFSETNAYVSRVKSTADRYRGLGGGTAPIPRIGARPGTPSVSTRNRYETIPGESMESERRALKMDYLSNRGKPGALLDLAEGLENAKDIPAQRVLVGKDRTLQYGPGTWGGKRVQRQPAGKRGRRGINLSPRGKWEGTLGPMEDFERLGKKLGLGVMSAKRHNTNPYSGSRSDHDFGNTDATARDMSNGTQPTPEMDEYAKRIADILGIRYRKGTPINKTVVRNGIRYQLIYRGDGEAFGGNHLNHVHLGAKRVGRGGRARGVLRRG